MAHTPGPWSVPHFARPDVNCNCKYVLSDTGIMGAVASVHCSGEGNDWERHGDNPRYEEAVANAHLISASPDLLEALEEALEVVNVAESMTSCRGDDDWIWGVQKKIKSAISKAKGEVK